MKKDSVNARQTLKQEYPAIYNAYEELIKKKLISL